MVSLAHEGMALMAENTDIDWAHQNKLREQWLLDNPNAQYIGWMSI
jgi:hypothetical protein